jgi:hypothetical protein
VQHTCLCVPRKWVLITPDSTTNSTSENIFFLNGLFMYQVFWNEMVRGTFTHLKWYLVPIILNSVGFPMSVPYEGYSRNSLYTLNLISMILLHLDLFKKTQLLYPHSHSVVGILDCLFLPVCPFITVHLKIFFF